MVYWISLKPGWKLQDVQAGLNVVVAFICAGCIFVLVRYCWFLAARRVTQEKDVPASSLLSLNTIGETLDVIWLLRREILTRRYHGLLLQCISVMLLTIGALLSGFIARFSTRYGTITMDRVINGSMAARTFGSISYAEVDTNATLYSLKNANFPQTQLLEYLPNIGTQWEYVADQWNSSWAMDCTYENSVNVPNVYSTGNCTNVLSEIPQIANNWKDFGSQYWYEPTGWRNNLTMFRDVLIFSHGVEWVKSYPGDDTLWTGLRVRTVAFHMYGVPYNTSIENTNCAYAEGPVREADYTMMTCNITRNITGETKTNLVDWGAYPDAYDLSIQTSSYIQHYGNNFRKQSNKDLDFQPFTGQELAMFYQAYMITKDTSGSLYTQRTMLVHVEVVQISLVTLVIATIGAALVVLGVTHYWVFLIRNWNTMNRTPQSKLDWMLRTLRTEGDTRHHHSGAIRQKLRDAMANTHHHGESVPLTATASRTQNRDSLRTRSIASSITGHPSAPEIDKGFDDGFETPMLDTSYPGPSSMETSWYPQDSHVTSPTQYQRVGSFGFGRQSSFGLGMDYGRNSNTNYAPVAQPLTQTPPQGQGRFDTGRGPKVWAGTHHVDTIYDPGRW